MFALAVQDGVQHVRVRNLATVIGLHALLHEVVRALLTAALAALLGGQVTVSAKVLDLLSRHAVGQLLFVVFQDFLAHAPLIRVLTHHALQDLLAAERTDEQLKGHVLVLLNPKSATRQLLEEIVNGSRAVVSGLRVLGSCGAALDNREEFAELNLAGAILVNDLHNRLHLLTVINQTQGNQRVLQLVHTDRAGAIVIERVKVGAQLVELLLLKLDAVGLAVLE